jgi:hypothetical protein
VIGAISTSIRDYERSGKVKSMREAESMAFKIGSCGLISRKQSLVEHAVARLANEAEAFLHSHVTRKEG